MELNSMVFPCSWKIVFLTVRPVTMQPYPADTDVLITHCPPYGILDFDDGINYGSTELLARVEEIKPRLHLFDHIHKQHGVKKDGSTIFSNGAIMNGDYTNFNFPNLIEI